MKLFEIYTGLLESAKTETEGLGILNKKGVENPEFIIQQFATGDVSQNGKNIPIMAYIYANGFTGISDIVSVLNSYDRLLNKQQVKPIVIQGDSFKVGNKPFADFMSFSEYIHGLEADNNAENYVKKSTEAAYKSEDKPIWSGNDIDIYEGGSVGKCIKYTQGSLTGRGYKFCIGQPGNTMYKSYRDSKLSSFYYIIDRNHFVTEEDGSVNLDDPLHIVVFDSTQSGIELTDANNNTGKIAEPYGRDVNKYVEYLKSKGVPVEKMVNNPKTPSEEEEEKLLGDRNRDLNWFMKLPMEYKSAYIGRGHLLTDEQFDYLIGY